MAGRSGLSKRALDDCRRVLAELLRVREELRLRLVELDAQAAALEALIAAYPEEEQTDA